ncbi:MAG: DUF4093 domain-containing protein [Bacillota bacterium]|nr:DUF4093 domain-containing protein [Bacillota bacterium]
MLKIRESIVVEGKGDARNLARYCEATFIVTGGIHISAKTYAEIERAIRSCGIIIFTDPDSAGRAIRAKIAKRFESLQDGIRHANITPKEGRKNGDLGVENAGEAAILAALSELKAAALDREAGGGHRYSLADMMELGLAGSAEAAKRRQLVCDKLRLPYANAKQLAKKLTQYGIEQTELLQILQEAPLS